jgi:hypothetical protein
MFFFFRDFLFAKSGLSLFFFPCLPPPSLLSLSFFPFLATRTLATKNYAAALVPGGELAAVREIAINPLGAFGGHGLPRGTVAFPSNYQNRRA